MSMTDEKITRYIILSRAPGLGPISQNRLLDACGDINYLFEVEEKTLITRISESCPGDSGTNTKMLHILLAARESTELQEEAKTLLEHCRKNDISLIVRDMPAYPDRFHGLPDMPVLLYTKGTLRLNDYTHSIGVIGARRCTREGKEQAIRISTEAVAADKAIISGMAKGIDSYAHTAAIKSLGYTIAVLGSGPDICYPREHQPLYETIAEHGCILSEYPPGTRPGRYRFPRRNRIIAALSDELYVIDAGRNSGTKTTISNSEQYGRKIIRINGEANSTESNHERSKSGDSNIIETTPGENNSAKIDPGSNKSGETSSGEKISGYSISAEKKMAETRITHSNKDLISKILMDRFGEKSFTMYGLDIPPIKEYLPAELPAVEAGNRTMDRFFRLTDDSYAIVEFESKYKRKNKAKYLSYITRVINRYIEDEELFIRFIVIYTGDVKSAPADFTAGCVTLKTTQAFLSHIDGDSVYDKIKRKIDNGELLEDEDQMHLIILPLTYKGDEKKRAMVDTVINTAQSLKEEEIRSFILAGVCVAANHYISKEQIARIGGALRMTKVGQMLEQMYERERISYGNEQRQAGIEQVARNMLLRGDDEDAVREVTGLTQAQIDRILGRKEPVLE